MNISKNLILLLSLVVLIMALPLGDGNVPAKIMLNVFAATVVLAGIYAMSGNLWTLVIGVLIGLPAMGGLFIVHFTPRALYRLPGMFMWITFYGYVAIITLKSVLSANRIRLGEIFGAISIYLLFGLAWGGIYKFIHVIDPHIFFFDKPHDLDHHLRLTEMIYFSYTTITNLGYVGIRPLGMVARSSVILESVFGIIYIVLLIVKMGGIYISERLSARMDAK